MNYSASSIIVETGQARDWPWRSCSRQSIHSCMAVARRPLSSCIRLMLDPCLGRSADGTSSCSRKFSRVVLEVSASGFLYAETGGHFFSFLILICVFWGSCGRKRGGGLGQAMRSIDAQRPGMADEMQNIALGFFGLFLDKERGPDGRRYGQASNRMEPGPTDKGGIAE